MEWSYHDFLTGAKRHLPRPTLPEPTLAVLPDVLNDVRTLAAERPMRHPTLLSALSWRELGSGRAMGWRDGRLVEEGGYGDPPAADEATLALPRRLEDVSPGARRFMERIEELVLERRTVLALIGGPDLLVPVDPPAMRLPFWAEPAEIGACALAARCLFLCGPWLVENAGPAGETRRRLAASIFLAGVVADGGGVAEEAVDAAAHLASVVLEDAGPPSRVRGRIVEFAARA